MDEGRRSPRRLFLLLALAASSGVILPAGPVGAQTSQPCEAVGSTSADRCDPFPAGAEASRERAFECLRYAASFANGDTVRQCVDQTTTTGFQDILPPRYEFDGGGTASRYLESKVDAVLEWAIAQPREGPADEVLYEAAFRQASAHGMFGDQQLVLALNAVSYANLPATVGDADFEAVARLDSRVCREPADLTPLSSINALATCQSHSDCVAPRRCLASRFTDADGVFGAVQEYRRGEQALLRAARALGPERLRELDRRSGADCGGVGCAARLLVRLGALRSQAQAELVEAYWRDAVARGADGSTAAMCAAPTTGQTCQVDADCDSGPAAGDGRCGADPRERSLVRLRQLAARVIAEGAAAQAVYARLAPGVATSETAAPDYDLLLASLARAEEVAARSTTSATPFGVPSDYVPFLSDGQRDFLQCTDDSSEFRCLLPLLTDDYFGALPSLELAQNDAEAELTRYVDSARNEVSHTSEMRNQLVDVTTRLLGVECAACSCSEARQEAGECVSLFGGEHVWEIQGAVCDDPGDLDPACTRTSADGEIERQIQAIRTAELTLQTQVDRYEFLVGLRETTEDNLARIQGIRDASCEDVQAALDEAQNAVNNAIEDRKEQIGGTTSDVATGLNVAAGVAAAAGAVIGGIVTGPAGGVAALPLLAGSAAGAGSLFGAVGGVFGSKSSEEEKREDLDLQQKLSEIENDRQKELQAIQCRETGAIAEIQGDEALLRIDGEIRTALKEALVARSQLAEAFAASNQLLTELARAVQRFREAQEFERIWAEGDPFRNPQNYRALALDAQVDRSQELRRAQELTWYLLRAAAYDLARPDFVIPQRGLTGSDIARVPAGECNEYQCTETGGISSSDCSATGDFFLGAAGETTPSDGSCSLRAVFAARSAGDLKSVLRSAFLELASSVRVNACSDGECDKTIKLRELFTDPLQPDRPTLGEVMVARGLEAGGPALAEGIGQIDFAITLDRDYDLCTERIDTTTSPPSSEWDCSPAATTGLTPDQENALVDGEFIPVGSGPADGETANVWNQNILTVAGQIRYIEGAHPNDILCRDAEGRPIAPSGFTSEEACTLFGSQPCTTAPPVGAGGGCFAISKSGDVPVALQQLAPGEVRTREAQRVDESTQPRDSIVSYRVRLGDLGAAQFSRFDTLVALTEVGFTEEDTGARGLPVASPGWRIRINTTGEPLQVDPLFTRAYLESIEDITLKFTYSAFELPAGN